MPRKKARKKASKSKSVVKQKQIRKAMFASMQERGTLWKRNPKTGKRSVYWGNE